MENNFKISVIIPVYNVEKYLKRCLDSVISQSYKNLEIILIDDGSTDNSGVICDEYAEKDNRIVLIHKSNGGVSDARNSGLKIFTGDFIIFVDSDDWIEKDFCEYIAKNMLDSDMLLFNYYVATTGKKKLKKIFLRNYNVLKEKCLLDLAKSKVESYVWNKAYKRQLFKDIIFPQNRNYEDQAIMHALIYESEKIKYVNRAFYNYFQNNNSITHTVNLKNYKDYLYVNILREKFYKKYYPYMVDYHINTIYSAIAKLCWLYSNDDGYKIRYMFLKKIILNKLLKNLFNHKISLKIKFKMLLALLSIDVIKLLNFKHNYLHMI